MLVFHTKLIENDVYYCEIDHIEQKCLDYIEFLFTKHNDEKFVYSRNDEICRELYKAILYKDDMPYFAPELVFLYKSTDLSRNENKQDFDTIYPHLSDENWKWLYNDLKTAFPTGTNGLSGWRIDYHAERSNKITPFYLTFKPDLIICKNRLAHTTHFSAQIVFAQGIYRYVV